VDDYDLPQIGRERSKKDSKKQKNSFSPDILFLTETCFKSSFRNQMILQVWKTNSEDKEEQRFSTLFVQKMIFFVQLIQTNSEFSIFKFHCGTLIDCSTKINCFDTRIEEVPLLYILQSITHHLKFYP